MTETAVKRKKVATRESLGKQIKDLQGGMLELVDHIRNLENQQVSMYVELTALKQFAAEGRIPTPEAFNKRCDSIYQSWAEKVDIVEQPVPEGQSEGRESATETLVAQSHEVSAREE